MNLETSPARSLPGLALGAWEGTAPAPSATMSLPAQPFTLWLSPDAWPRPALKLPGNAHTLWLDPETWPRSPHRLPGAAFTVWLDEARWPAVKPPALDEIPATVSPAAEEEPPPMEAFPIILDATVPVEPTADAELPVAAELEAPRVSLEIPVMPEPPVAVEPEWVATTQEPLAAIDEPPTLVEPAVFSNSNSVSQPEPVMSPPIVLRANHSFTLWTTAAALAVPAREVTPPPVTATTAKPKFRLPGQPFTLWTQPGRVEPIPMRNGAPASAAKSIVPMPASSFVQRWLPLAAGFVIAAFGFMAYLSQKEQREKAEEDLATLKRSVDVDVASANAAAKKAGEESLKASSELKAKEADFKSQMAELQTQYNNAVAESKARAAVADEKSAALEKAKKELSDASKDFASRESVLQKNAATATEELSKAKRAASEEVSKAKETIARLEEEKAAAVKDSSAAMADRDVLKVEVDKLRKQLEGKNRPPAAPEA